MNAELNSHRITVDRFGNVYESEISSQRVRVINNSGYIYTVAGIGIAGYSGDGGLADLAKINQPYGLTVDSCGNLYIADAFNYRIRKVTYPKCNYLNVGQLANVSQETSIYPNPATDELHIEGLTTRSEYMLLNVTGIIAQRGILEAGSNTIRINALPMGLHLLALIDEDGNRTVHKITKQ